MERRRRTQAHQSAYARLCPRISWTVQQHGRQIAEGDEVYLWRAAGRKRGVAGIVALARVVSPIWAGLDHAEAQRFWKHPTDAEVPEDRVWLSVLGYSAGQVLISRPQLLADPACQNMLILRQAAGTNFPVEPVSRAGGTDRCRVGESDPAIGAVRVTAIGAVAVTRRGRRIGSGVVHAGVIVPPPSGACGSAVGCARGAGCGTSRRRE